MGHGRRKCTLSHFQFITINFSCNSLPFSPFSWYRKTLLKMANFLSVWVPKWLTCVRVCLLTPVWLSVTPWTGSHQAPLSMGFSRKDYWSWLLFPTPGDLPGPEMEPAFSTLAGRHFTTVPPGKLEWLTSVQFSRSGVSDSLQPRESQHARPLCPSTTPRVHPDSRPLNQWCHPAISSSVVPFSSCPQSLPASESSPMSQVFTWGGQRTGVSALASFLPKKSQGWSPSEWTHWISLQSKGLSRVFSNTTVQKHRFFGAQPSSQSNSHIHTWPLEKP